MKRLYIWLLATLPAVLAYGQSNDVEQFTQVSKGFKLSERWSADVRSELRLSWYEGTQVQLRWTQLYLQGGIAYRLAANWVAGATYRLSRRGDLREAPEAEHRFAQQISASQNIQKYRLRERLMFEQRIFPDGTEHRWRFRVGADYPLNGEKLDPGEWYLNHQAALLIEPFEAAVLPNREHRFYTGMGTRFGNGSRLEIGVEARLSRVPIEGYYDSRWVLRTNYSI